MYTANAKIKSLKCDKNKYDQVRQQGSISQKFDSKILGQDLEVETLLKRSMIERSKRLKLEKYKS